MDAVLQEALTNLTRYGNSFGATPEVRAEWTRHLGFPVKDARKEPVHYLWFVGDYCSFDPRVAPATRAAAHIFRRAGIDFGILYDAEFNSGNDVRLRGEDHLFATLRERNRAVFSRAHFEEIVTTDPHSFHVLRNEYSPANGSSPVLHHTQLFRRLLASGDLLVRRRLNLKVTYHDPCYLGRYNAIFEAPRRVMAAIGLKLIEMPQNRVYSYCCGAGGCRIWMQNPPVIRERPAVTRVREAAMLDGVRTLVVVCPKDLVMFQDAIRITGLEDRLEVKELAELVDQATL